MTSSKSALGIVILIDSREQCPLKISVPTETVLLPCGDYSLRGHTDKVVIERKRLNELAVCCGADRERFISQLERMQAYEHRALVIECDLENILSGSFRSQIHPLSVLGTLIKAAVDMRIQIWFAGSAENAALVVERYLLRVAKLYAGSEAA